MAKRISLFLPLFPPLFLPCPSAITESRGEKGRGWGGKEGGLLRGYEGGKRMSKALICGSTYRSGTDGGKNYVVSPRPTWRRKAQKTSGSHFLYSVTLFLISSPSFFSPALAGKWHNWRKGGKKGRDEKKDGGHFHSMVGREREEKSPPFPPPPPSLPHPFMLCPTSFRCSS